MFAKGSSASSTRPVSEAKCRSLGEQILHEGPAVTFQMPGRAVPDPQDQAFRGHCNGMDRPCPVGMGVTFHSSTKESAMTDSMNGRVVTIGIDLGKNTSI
jgi:hypothetical protein